MGRRGFLRGNRTPPLSTFWLLKAIFSYITKLIALWREMFSIGALFSPISMTELQQDHQEDIDRDYPEPIGVDEAPLNALLEDTRESFTGSATMDQVYQINSEDLATD